MTAAPLLGQHSGQQDWQLPLPFAPKGPPTVHTRPLLSLDDLPCLGRELAPWPLDAPEAVGVEMADPWRPAGSAGV
jgi:hypothetical protein